MIKWIVVLHVLSGAAWFGGQLYVEGLTASAARTKESSTIMTVTLRVAETSSRIFSIAGILLLVTGVWIVLDDSLPYGFDMMFVSIGFLIVIFGLGIGIFYFRPKGVELKEIVDQQGLTSVASLDKAKQVGMMSHVMTLLVTIAIIVMVLRPGS